MAATRAERNAYGRGYSAGMRRSWPKGWPPSPPEPVIRRLLDAVFEIRNSVDSWRAQIAPNDEWIVEMDRMIDAADDAGAAVIHWLASPLDAVSHDELEWADGYLRCVDLARALTPENATKLTEICRRLVSNERRTAQGRRSDDAHAVSLTAEQVIQIRERAASGESGRALGREFGVSQATISKVTTGKTWRHVGGPRSVLARRRTPGRR